MNIPKSLKEALEANKSLELVSKHLILLDERILSSYDIKERLESLLIAEYEDVEALEKKSIKGLFVSILGDKKQQLEIERQEYLHAFLEFKEHNNCIKLLEKQKLILQEKLQNSSKIKIVLERKMLKHEADIRKMYPQKNDQFRQINNQILKVYNLKREIHEVLIVATKALRLLDQMCRELKKTKDWGKWKTYYSQIQKQKLEQKSAFDNAQQLAYAAKEFLLQFEVELKDILKLKKIPVHYNLDGLHHFMNINFENLISDWVIREKVRNSLHSIESLADSVRRIHNSLNNEIIHTDNSIKYLEEKKQKLILGG